MILLDTNVISEVMSPSPDARVMAWMDSQDPDEIWTCTIVVAEVLSGLDLMPEGRRQARLRELAERMFISLFAGRIFDLDLAAARAYGRVLKIKKSIGRPIDEADGLIGATAFSHGATLATRNIADFEHCGIPLVDPWQDG